MIENSTDNNLLKAKQAKALAAIMLHSNLEDAAKACGISRSTINRWLAAPAFQSAIMRVESETITLATRRLVMLSEKAINTLEYTLDNPSASDGVKVRAAQTILDYLLRLREMVSLENRITLLERTGIHDNQE